jgi:predicted nucleic acid-binding protein
MATAKIICDTDVMIDYLNITNSRYAATKKNLEENIGLDNVVISAITKMELIVGALNKIDLAKAIKKFDRFNLAIIDDKISHEAIYLIERYSLSHRLAIPDALIAATAIVDNLELFTYNTRDYKFISELKLFMQ